LADLGGKSFWLDEAFSVALARAPWAEFMVQLRTREANMSLYYVLLRAWLHLGNGEATVRLLSALPGIATIPVVYAIGARLFGRPAGLGAATLFAVDAFHILVSQDARSYPLAVFLITCSIWALLHIVGDPDDAAAAVQRDTTRSESRAWAPVVWGMVYVIASAGAVYAHFYAALVLLAQAGWLLARPAQMTPWRQLIAWGLGTAVLLVPVAMFVLGGPHTNIDWLATAIPTLSSVLHGAATPAGFIGGAAFATVPVALTWGGIQVIRSGHATRHRWSYVLILLWLLTPIVIPLVVSVTVKPVLEPRYITVCIPAVVLLAGAIASQLPGTRKPIAMLAAIIAAQAYGDWAYFAWVEKENWRDATRTILTAAAPGDVAVFYAPYVRRPYDYYVERFGRPANAPLVLYPATSYADFAPSGQAALSLRDAVDRASRAAPRTWLVLSHATPDTACRRSLDAALRAVYGTVEDREFTRVDVRLYSNRGAGAHPEAGRLATPAQSGSAVADQCPQQ